MARKLRGKQIADQTIELANLSTAAIEALKFIKDPKDACRMVALANVADLANAVVADIDGQGQGITLVEGDRVLLVAQTDQTENGIYDVGVVGAGVAPLTRSPDANEDAEVTQGMSSLIVEGDKAGSTYYLQTQDPITLGVTNLVFAEIAPFPGGGGQGLNIDLQDQAALTTTTDGDQAITAALPVTPVGNVKVNVNGQQAHLAGDLTGEFYFSGDGGTTARALGAAVATDTLHFNGSVAGYQLDATTDRIDVDYVAPN